VREKVNVLKVYSERKGTAIELLEASNKDSAIEKYINNKGQGIHHIALNVDNILNAIDYLKNNDIELVYEKPNLGANNKLITFIHPKSSPGMLIELCQKV
jgi:methylmalonyl-CoA/ethylmalonyl-CoA epimerase